MTYVKENHLLPIYNPYKLEVKKAKGMYIYTKNCKYLDMFSGIAVNSLGHLNKNICRAIKKQMNKHLHLSNYFEVESTKLLANMLVSLSKLNKVLFTNSGTEANEAALKFARIYGNKNNKDKILAFKNSFHGRTFGSMSLTGQKDKVDKFKPLIENIKFLEFNILEDLKTNVDENTCAIFLELIQGEAGINLIDEKYINELINLRNEFNFLIIVDEIQTGLLRTGKMFNFELYNLTPNIITLAKSLGGGLPLGAVVIDEGLSSLISKGDHGSTFAANPLSSVAGFALVNELTKEDTINKVKKMSDFLFKRLQSLKNFYPDYIKEIRGLGLIIGIEIIKDVELIQELFFEEKVLINITNKNVIRLLPAFIIKKKEIDIFIDKFSKILTKLRYKND